MPPTGRLAICALATLVLLTGCTSAEEPEASSPSEAAVEGEVPEGDWWCRLIQREIVEAAAGDRVGEAREVLRQNDTEGFLCEVVLPRQDGGSETLAALQVVIDDQGAVERVREQAADAGAQPGPEHLGESYLWPGHAAAIVPCGAPAGTEDAGSQVPYVFTMSAEGAAGVDEDIADPLTRSLVDADQAVGCSPSEARPDGAKTTG